MGAPLMYARTAGLALVALSQLAIAASGVAPRDSQIALLKDWALSRCLAKVYADPAATKDANATASAYLEEGDLPIEAYHALDQLATDYANRKYSGSIDPTFGTKKCIDLFESDALRALAIKQVDSKAKTR